MIFDNNINQKEFEQIDKIIRENNLSWYLLDRKDIVAIKNQVNEILAFWRIYEIEKDVFELWSVYVTPSARWEKLWQEVIKYLIAHHNKDKDLFLACKSHMIDYYRNCWFEVFQDEENLPEKLIYTKKWMKENNYEGYFMKYKN